MLGKYARGVALSILTLLALTACSDTSSTKDFEPMLGTYKNAKASHDAIYQGKLQLDANRCVMLVHEQGEILALFPVGSEATQSGVKAEGFDFLAYGISFEYTGSPGTSSAEITVVPDDCPSDNVWVMQPVE